VARRFQFRLEPVRKLRARAEERRLLDFARAQGEVVREEEHLRRLAEEKERQQEEIVGMIARGEDFHHVVGHYRYIGTLNRTGTVRRAELARLRQRMEERREVYLASRRDRRALDILRDRAREAHEREEARQESAAVNELATLRHRLDRRSTLAEED
jgi:flagellar protein FliJ